MSELTDDRLLPCPFCGVPLEIRSGKNPYGRHPRDSECIMAAHAVNIPHDVERWNRRAAASTSTEGATLIEQCAKIAEAEPVIYFHDQLGRDNAAMRKAHGIAIAAAIRALAPASKVTTDEAEERG